MTPAIVKFKGMDQGLYLYIDTAKSVTINLAEALKGQPQIMSRIINKMFKEEDTVWLCENSPEKIGQKDRYGQIRVLTSRGYARGTRGENLFLEKDFLFVNPDALTFSEA